MNQVLTGVYAPSSTWTLGRGYKLSTCCILPPPLVSSRKDAILLVRQGRYLVTYQEPLAQVGGELAHNGDHIHHHGSSKGTDCCPCMLISHGAAPASGMPGLSCGPVDVCHRGQPCSCCACCDWSFKQGGDQPCSQPHNVFWASCLLAAGLAAKRCYDCCMMGAMLDHPWNSSL
jgi:hypothetical protein